MILAKNKFLILTTVVMTAGAYFMLRPAKNVRNNNPLNIERGDDWKGLQAIQNDQRFAQFTSPEYGFRAAYIILLRYLERDDNTLIKIIAKWAPSHENDSNAYAEYLANKLEQSPVEEITPQGLPLLMLHMSNFEGAKGAFTFEQAVAGADLAKQEDFVIARLARISEVYA